MNDTDLINAIERGDLNPRNYRRCPDGSWEYFHQADGPANNRWVRFPDLRACLNALKANDDTIAAARLAAKQQAEAAADAKPAAAAKK